jgi:hypothetical protein
MANKIFVDKLLVTGSRTIRDYQLVRKALLNYDCKEVIVGGASGVDNIAERYYRNTHSTGIDLVPVKNSDYKKFGNYAYILRDRVMANRADYCVAIWDGMSRGTMHTVGFCEERGIPVDIYTIHKDNKGNQILKKNFVADKQLTLV